MRVRSGFSIIEVMIALLVLGVGIVPVIGLFTQGSRTVEKGGLILEATIAGQNLLDRAKSDSFLWDHLPGESKGVVIEVPDSAYPQFTLPAFFAKKYHASGTITIEFAPDHTVIGTGEPETNLIQISVTLGWIENQRLRTTRLLTYRANTNIFDLKTSAKF